RGLPALKCPVGAVRRLAAGDEPRELRAVVGLAAVLERLPGEPAVTPAGVVELEGELTDLGGARAMARVDRAPGEKVRDLPARGIGDHRSALRVHLELDVRGVPRDQLGGARRRDETERAHDRAGAHDARIDSL